MCSNFQNQLSAKQKNNTRKLIQYKEIKIFAIDDVLEMYEKEDEEKKKKEKKKEEKKNIREEQKIIQEQIKQKKMEKKKSKSS